MRYSFTILFFWTLTGAYSQTNNLLGIYEANWGGPSYRYPALDCDSTYHFITHWNFGGKKNIKPAMADKKRWTIQDQAKVILETPTYGIKSFDIQPGEKLYHKFKKQSNTWTKIMAYDESCSVQTYTELHSSNSYTVTNFLPDFVIGTSERFKNEKLEERITYYILTKQEIDTLRGFKSRSQRDPVMEIKMKLAAYDLFWPKEKIEKWENGVLTTSFFDKKGQLIRKE